MTMSGNSTGGNGTMPSITQRSAGIQKRAVVGLNGRTSLSQDFADYATDAEVCLVFLNAFSGEGADRTELRDTEQDAMVTTVAENCNNTVVVINSVSPRILDS